MGGGNIITIILMIGLKVGMKEAIQLTYIFIFGGSIATLVKTITKKNPNTGGPLLDYNLIMISMPMVAIGSMFGVIIL